MSNPKSTESKKKRVKGVNERTLSSVREQDVLAVVCSDIHARSSCPPARSGEEDWFGVMKGYFEELSSVCHRTQAPLLVAGDLFDTWRSSAELINLMLSSFPDCKAIPGQHDLPYHNHEEIKKSAFHTLRLAGQLSLITEPTWIVHTKEKARKLLIQTAPWGKDIPKPKKTDKWGMNILLAHQYVWKSEHKYTGAPDEAKLGTLKKQLKGYDFAIFGDNHLGFLAKSGDCHVMNCGAFMRTKSDQEDYKPMIGLITVGGIVPYYMNVSNDKFERTKKDIVTVAAADQKEAIKFIKELRALGNNEFSFQEMLKRKRGSLGNKVNTIIDSILDTYKD